MLHTELPVVAAILWALVGLLGSTAMAQVSFVNTPDTTIDVGSSIVLWVDTTLQYNNFLFAAKLPATNRWTIWRLRNQEAMYSPLFTDRYNRIQPVVSADHREMIYVRYAMPKPNAMHLQQLDSAWVCSSKTDGTNEQILLLVPDFKKNAVYDLDWSADKQRILLSIGNDAYPTLTRDGDIFEWEQKTGKLTNLTHQWELWSNHARYFGNDGTILYSHYNNFWYEAPTDVFERKPDNSRKQRTNSLLYEQKMQFCTLTDVNNQSVMYRRGDAQHNALYIKDDSKETIVSDLTGFGGVWLENEVYAATDTGKSIVIVHNGTVDKIKIRGINNFANDNNYNVRDNLNVHLNWAGRKKMTVRWDNATTGSEITVKPETTTTYRCTINWNGLVFKDSVVVYVRGKRPTIKPHCGGLKAGEFMAYQWLLNNEPIEGATDRQYQPENTGKYCVRAVDKKGNTTLSDEYYWTPEAADRDGSTTKSIFADPITNVITIKAADPFSVVVANAKGKQVFAKKNSSSINMDNFPDGVYEVTVTNNTCNSSVTKKIIKSNNN